MEKAQEIELRNREVIEREMDFWADQADEIGGLGRMGARFRDQPRRRPPDILAMTQPVFHNIQISNSVVGSVNTGTAHNIDVKITQLQDAGHADLAEAIRSLTQAILTSDALKPVEKDEALQAIEAVSVEAHKPEAERRLGLVRLLLAGLSALTAKSADLLQIWQAVKPVILPYFGIDPPP